SPCLALDAGEIASAVIAAREAGIQSSGQRGANFGRLSYAVASQLPGARQWKKEVAENEDRLLRRRGASASTTWRSDRAAATRERLCSDSSPAPPRTRDPPAAAAARGSPRPRQSSPS